MDSLRGTREAPGRHQGGRKGLIGQPARHSEQERTLWTACEAPGRQARRQERIILDSPGGTREVPERQGRTIWTAREAPGRQERTNWTACETPGRHQRGRKGLFWTAREAPGRY